MDADATILDLIASGEFEIDDEGRIWRLLSRGKPCRKRAENKTGCGYLQLRRMVDGYRIHIGAHRVVWMHFNGPIPDGYQIHHLNGIKDDNRPENLRLVTASENNSRAHQDGLRDQRGEKNPSAVLSNNEVAQIRLAYAQGGYTQASLADRFGVSHKTISKIIRGERRASQGGPIRRDNLDRQTSGSVRDRSTGRYCSGRLLDGRTWDEYPEVAGGHEL